MSEIIKDCQIAKTLLEQQDIVAIPTETVYGIAADAHSQTAIAKIYTLKQRPLEKALALNIHPSWSIETWCQDIPSYTYKLIKKFWPGPLTIILPARKENLLPLLIGPNDTLALRCPAHPLTLELLKQFNKPIVAPSANPSNHFSAVTAKQVQNHFPLANLKILDGGQCVLGIESTILKINNEKSCEILRFGAISADEITNCIGFKPNLPQTLNKNQQFLGKPIYYFSEINELPKNLKGLCTVIAPKRLNGVSDYGSCLELSEDINQAQYQLYSLLAKAEKAKEKITLIYLAKDSPPTLRQQILKFAKPVIEFTNI
jgi:L-threonylcarbamoyladenylate synthase